LIKVSISYLGVLTKRKKLYHSCNY